MGDLLGLTVAAHTFDSSPILGIALQKHCPQTVYSEMTLFHFCLNACLMRKKIKFSGFTNLGSRPCSRLILMSHLLLLGKFEYTGGPIFKVVLEC